MLAGANAGNLGAERDRVQDVNLVFERGVDGAFGHACHHGAGHGAVEERAVPAAMESAHRVGEGEGGGTAKFGEALFDTAQSVVQGLADGRAGEFSGQDLLHELKPGDRQGVGYRGQLGGGFGVTRHGLLPVHGKETVRRRECQVLRDVLEFRARRHT